MKEMAEPGEAMARWAQPEVVAHALSGSQSAVEQLVTTIWPRCYRLAATVIGDLSLAQDAAQEACIIITQKIRKLRNVSAFDTWVYRITMREAARMRRHRSLSTNEAPYTGEPYGNIAEAVDLWRALAALPPQLRDVTVLFYFDDFRTHEIAAILRVPHVTVRTRLKRARERLRVTLGDFEPHATAKRGIKQHAF
jgi:RNA polymerase sigma-70 factor, ECF subfamily